MRERSERRLPQMLGLVTMAESSNCPQLPGREKKTSLGRRRLQIPQERGSAGFLHKDEWPSAQSLQRSMGPFQLLLEKAGDMAVTPNLQRLKRMGSLFSRGHVCYNLRRPSLPTRGHTCYSFRLPSLPAWGGHTVVSLDSLHCPLGVIHVITLDLQHCSLGVIHVLTLDSCCCPLEVIYVITLHSRHCRLGSCVL